MARQTLPDQVHEGLLVDWSQCEKLPVLGIPKWQIFAYSGVAVWRGNLLTLCAGGREKGERSGCSAKVYSALVLWIKPSLNSLVNL